MKRYQLQHRSGLPADGQDYRSYKSLAAAKGQLTRLVRRYRIFSYRVVDLRTQQAYVYDEQKRAVVPVTPEVRA